MKLISPHEFTPEQKRALKKAKNIEYLSLAYLVSVATLMYLVMGSSQAMKTAWIEDCLSMVPPLCFLIGNRLRWMKPTVHYPYGFHRVISILFLCASLSLLVVGGYLLVDSLVKLFTQEHPTIGMKEYFGIDMWLGWWMIPVLLWGTFPPVLLGHIKIKYARILNDKILITDGKMNKADWMTAVAAIAGIIGIGFGLWWADAAAAAFISFDILKDGWHQTKDAATGLINRAPTSINGHYLDLDKKIKKLIEKKSWAKNADIRLYEHGHIFLGEAYISIQPKQNMTARRQKGLLKEIYALDWRLKEFVLTLR